MDLDKLRKRINKIDRELIDILNERTRVVQQIGRYKHEQGMSFYAPHREQEVFKKITDMNEGPMPDHALHAIYREIMSSSLHLEKPLRISYLGPEASYTNQAATKKFGSSLHYSAQPTTEEVFLEVARGKANYGVVPVENSMEGAVYHTLDMFATSDLKICAQITLPITHHLLSRAESLEDIEVIYAHSQVVAQCRKWLDNHLTGATIEEAQDGIHAAQEATRDRHSAAIANILAADTYRLNVMADNIQSVEGNTTRYLVLSTESANATGDDKTSIMFGAPDRVGSLVEILQTMREHDINMSKIESRPSRREAWNYYFFVDFYGHQTEEGVREMLAEVRNKSTFVKILGSYPNID